MNLSRSMRTPALGSLWFVLTGCSASKVDFVKLQRPPRAEQLAAYDVFVGKWNWTASMLDRDGVRHDWVGSASWEWTLDRRCLEGKLSARSGDTTFAANGVWSWHPTRNRYIWWMFNDWGFPQEGTARYEARQRRWTMPYRSVGLDGTTSHGRYVMQVIDDNTLSWRMDEWIDPLGWIRKSSMEGQYTRVK